MIQNKPENIIAGLSKAGAVLLAAVGPAAWAQESVLHNYTAEQVANPTPKTVTPDVLGTIFNVGPFGIRPALSGSVLYDDNIRIAEDNTQDDLIWIFTPQVTIGLGDAQAGTGNFLSLDYVPRLYIYTDHDENNALDHEVNFRGQWAWSKLTVGLGQAYLHGSGGVVEVGDRVDRDTYLTTLRSRYELGSKTSVEVNLRQTVAVYDESEGGQRVNDYNEWINENWFNYQLSEKINTGAGVTLGARDVVGPNQLFEQLLIRGGYAVTEKVNVQGSIGAEFRQYEDEGDEGPALVFSLGGAYAPRDTTALTMEAYRRDVNSVVTAAENYTVTGVRAGVRQRFLRRYVVGLAGGYEHASYRTTGQGPSTDREDDYFFVSPDFAFNITEKWDVGVFYLHRENSSNQAGLSFDNNQAGLRTTFRF